MAVQLRLHRAEEASFFTGTLLSVFVCFLPEIEDSIDHIRWVK